MKQANFLVFLMCLHIQAAVDQPIMAISIPKTGTHLLKECLTLITGRQGLLLGFKGINPPLSFYHMDPTISKQAWEIPKNSFYFTHLLYKPEYQEVLEAFQFKIILCIRDPRDQLISNLFWARKNCSQHPTVFKLNFDETIMDLIVYNTIGHNHPPTQGIVDLYQSYDGWRHMPNVYVVRFEDLIGERGGGSTERQQHIIKELADFCGCALTKNEVDAVAASMWGKGPTFRDGKIGSWKRYFTQEHKDTFKKVAGQLLIDLAYEKDLNW